MITSGELFCMGSIVGALILGGILAIMTTIRSSQFGKELEESIRVKHHRDCGWIVESAEEHPDGSIEIVKNKYNVCTCLAILKPEDKVPPPRVSGELGVYLEPIGSHESNPFDPPDFSDIDPLERERLVKGSWDHD